MPDVKTLAVLGAGQMGGGIAQIAAAARRGDGAQQEDDRHQRQILEQQHREGRAADLRLGADHRQH